MKTTFLREIYEVLGCFSTATRIAMCGDLLRRLDSKGKDNLACFFADALSQNDQFDQRDTGFVPVGRNNQLGTNPVTSLMQQHGNISIGTPLGTNYAFRFCQREVPHLRANTLTEQPTKAWIDYVACTDGGRPILGEIKCNADNDPFYAFIQLLTYLSEMATPNQIQRALKHRLFGDEVTEISAFDLHIFLVDFNDRGEKRTLIDLTRELASEFKRHLQMIDQNSSQCIGNIMCLSAEIENENSLSAPVLRWMV